MKKSMDIPPKRILVVYQHYGDPATIRKAEQLHLHCMNSAETPHEIIYYNIAEDAPTSFGSKKPPKIPDRLKHITFDVILFFNSILGYRTIGPFFYEWKRYFDWFRDFDCLKIALPQDDYDCAGILDEWLYDWGISVVLTPLAAHAKTLYPILHTNAAFYPCLTGYIDEESARRYSQNLMPLREREGDVFYRARKLMYYLGSFGQLKNTIAEVVGSRAGELGYTCDISTRIEDVIFGDLWFERLAGNKVVFGCESGASAINWRDEIRARENVMRCDNPDLTFDEFKARMPPDWDRYKLSAIGPRHLECVFTKTLQILIEGTYQGVLEPNDHYIPLKNDYSNLDEALLSLKDTDYVQALVDRAYEEIYLSGRYTYRAFARLIERAIMEHEEGTSGAGRGKNKVDTTASTDAVEALERQIVVLRQENLRLEANLNYTTLELGKIPILESQLEFATSEQKKYQALRQKLLVTMVASLLIAAGSVLGLVIGIVLLLQH